LNFFRTYLFLAFIALSFFGCKKYPENKLWFKDPKKAFKGGKITSYTVNGADRMPYFRNLYYGFPYNYYGTSIDDVFSIPFNYDAGGEKISTIYGSGGFHFSKTKREIEISFVPVNADYGAESIFPPRQSWKVMKLTKDGVLKIQVDYNMQLHEIQFN
jgi:hypothetical protein